MPSFGSRSTTHLSTVHPALQALFAAVVVKYDCSVLSGRRTAEEQQELHATGKSTKDGITSFSRHQPEAYEPGVLPLDGGGLPLVSAVDVAVYPIDWNDRDRFLHFAGYVDGVATSMGITLRWGGDWNRNAYTDLGGLRDQTFFDLVHFEIHALDARWK